MTETLKMEPVGANKGGGQQRQDDNEDYDPHLHRELEAPTTNTETLIHLLKGCLGTGILAMPEAFKYSGMACGIVSTGLIGALCAYCLHVLVHSQYILCKRLKVALLTYPESMKVACEMGPNFLKKFAPYAPGLVNFFLIFYQMGICCVYVVFVGVNIKAVGDVYTTNDLPLPVYTLSVFIPFVLILCIRNLKLLAPFSVLANIITFVTFGVVCFYVFQDLPVFSKYESFGTLQNYPLYFGTTLFSLQAVGVVIALENNMATPKSFLGTFGVLNTGMIIVTIIYVGMGMMGYWRYGEVIEGSITLNFPPNEILAQAIKVLYSIAIYISYGLQGYVPVQIIWTNYMVKKLENSDHKMKWEYLLRLLCVVVTFALALTVPLLGLFISLVGSFCLSALGIAFPAIIELCAHWPNNLGPGKIIVIKDVILIIIGIVGLCAGSYSCIYEIVRQLSGATAPVIADQIVNATKLN